MDDRKKEVLTLYRNTDKSFTGMRTSVKITPKIQWAAVHLSRLLNHDQITMCLDLSTWCYSMGSGTHFYSYPSLTVDFWLTIYIHNSCHILHRHFPLPSLVTISCSVFNECLSPKLMTHWLVSPAYILFHDILVCSIPWSVHILWTYKYHIVLYY